jgi:hypothetical protein
LLEDEQSVQARADALKAHNFVFLNRPAEFLPSPVDWSRAPDGDRLWAYNLHYGEWALVLANAFNHRGDPSYRDSAIHLMSDWIEHNQPGRGTGWEPYPLARRLVAWSKTSVLLALDTEWQVFWTARAAASFRRQYKFLTANIEKDLAGNHLLAGLHALAWVWLLFPTWPEAAKAGPRAFNALWEELDKQILPDGFHCERSISYQAIVLQDALETFAQARASGVEVPSGAEPLLQRMVQALRATRAPDGSWPLLNDSVVDYPADTARLVEIASAMGLGGRDPDQDVEVMRDAGYVVLGAATENTLLFDAGPMGSKGVLAHGHADTLSFVLWAGRRSLVVDPGVFTYTAGPIRDHYRSTRAHNTVTVDGLDQCAFWGAFKVAFAPEVRLLRWSPTRVEGESIGYRYLPTPITHRRRIDRLGPTQWAVEDRLECDGLHSFTSSLQFSEGGRVSISGSGATVSWPDGTQLLISSSDLPAGATIRQEPGTVSRTWNVSYAAPRLVTEWTSEGPTHHRFELRVVGSG